MKPATPNNNTSQYSTATHWENFSFFFRLRLGLSVGKGVTCNLEAPMVSTMGLELQESLEDSSRFRLANLVNFFKAL